MPSPPFVHSKEISLHTLFKLAGELFWHCDPCVIILGHVATTPGGVCLTPAKQALTVIHISTVSALSEAVCEPVGARHGNQKGRWRMLTRAMERLAGSRCRKHWLPARKWYR